jgi:hypothetical protein
VKQSVIRVRVTLRLTVSLSICFGVEPRLGLMTRYLLQSVICCRTPVWKWSRTGPIRQVGPWTLLCMAVSSSKGRGFRDRRDRERERENPELKNPNFWFKEQSRAEQLTCFPTPLLPTTIFLLVPRPLTCFEMGPLLFDERRSLTSTVDNRRFDAEKRWQWLWILYLAGLNEQRAHWSQGLCVNMTNKRKNRQTYSDP